MHTVYLGPSHLFWWRAMPYTMDILVNVLDCAVERRASKQLREVRRGTSSKTLVRDAYSFDKDGLG